MPIKFFLSNRRMPFEFGGRRCRFRSYLRLFVYLFVSFLGQIYSYNVKKRNRKLLETIVQKIRGKKCQN